MNGACVGGDGWGLGREHLVMRYTIKIKNVETTTCLNSNVRTLLIIVMLRYTCFKFVWLVNFC